MSDRPKIVCLCGSTRFRREYEQAFRDEEHAGRICLTVPCFKSDPCCKSPADWAVLDALHRHKIDMADEILVINPAYPWCPKCGLFRHQSGHTACMIDRFELRPYFGEFTRAEIDYAESLGKPIRYLTPALNGLSNSEAN